MLASSITYALVAPAVTAVAVIALTYVFTNVRYYFSLWRVQSRTGKGGHAPLKIPYAFPVLGNALDFMNGKPGSFWTRIFQWHPRTAGPFTLKMGGRNMHIVHDPHTIQALFKARSPNRHAINLDIVTKAFGIDRAQAQRYYGVNDPPQEIFDGRTPLGQQELIWTNFLLRTDRVNELTATFIQFLENEFSSDLPKGETEEVGLYAWLRPRMFNASTIAFLGSKWLEDYPDLEKDFFEWECISLTAYFGIPRWLSPKVYILRDKLTAGLTRWQENTLERSKGQVVDPEGDVSWEPVWGSRANRSRQVYYNLRGSLTTQTRALMDLGFLFGISSNATPATGWVLMHILDPSADKTLYPKVMKAIKSSRRPDGSFDIPTLVNQPLLLSIVHEVLRLYSDFLVTRELPENLTLPAGTTGDKVFLRNGSTVVAPNWIKHRDETFWDGPSPHTFYAERFLTTDPDTSKETFSTASMGGQLFPFGGGKAICPGRVFARQEILASVAMALSEFEFEVVGYLNRDGKGTDSFPVIQDAYPGTAIFTMNGDFKVKIKRRT